jgi:ribosome maturation protein SDO1
MQTTARVTKKGKHYEILVDLDEALKIRKDGGDVNSAVETDCVFHNLKAGEKASEDELKRAFGTDNFLEVSKEIIKSGEVVLPTEYLQKEQEGNYKRVVDFLSKNAVSPEGKPYTPDRIMKVLKEANVNIKKGQIDYQIPEILEQIQKILPIKIEMKKMKITIPAQHTGKAYGLLQEYKESEEWLSNGDLVAILRIPKALEFDFYDKLNSITHGSALSEEIKAQDK